MHDRLAPTAVLPHATPPPPTYVAFLLFGVLLPAFTLGFELFTAGCAQLFFDPIPTLWHILLVALVPTVNAIIWWKLRNPHLPTGRAFSYAAGASLGISICYAALFLPMLPFSLMGVLFGGLGFLSMAPVTAAWAGFRGVSALRRTAPNLRILPGVFLGILALAVPFSRGLLTESLLERAALGTPAARDEAVQWLRRVGDKNLMLERAYGRSAVIPIVGRTSRLQVDPPIVQQIYYRVTGRAFDQETVPRSVAFGGRGWRGLRFDPDLGSERIGSKIPDLAVKASTIETQIDPTALTSYTEWTLLFVNTASVPNEARAQIQLPPHGVISRVTLWINGEPQEAAFGGREQTTAAYREVVVVERRDPILVTTAGAGRILMQCFPVPANGGEMKVRIGITAPLQPLSATQAEYAFPHLADTNFNFASGLEHQVRLEQSAHDGGAKSERRTNLRADTENAPSPVTVNLPSSKVVIAPDPRDAQYVIRQTVVPAAKPPDSQIWVIDGSVEMAAYQSQLVRIAQQAKQTPTAVFFAGERVEQWSPRTELPTWLAERTFVGGRDNVPALETAWQSAIETENSSIIWIHRPTTTELENPAMLGKSMARSARKPAVYDVPVEAGANIIAAKLESALPLRFMPPRTSPLENLEHLLASLHSDQRLEILRERVPSSSVPGENATGNGHVVRLWGNEEALAAGYSGKVDAARKLAMELRLVTPWTGAVVLETKAQYERHGLDPGDPEIVPAIPEPGTALLLTGAGMALLLRRRRVSRCHVA
jgi:hypothetical protein